MAEKEVKNAMKVLEDAKCLEQQGQAFYAEAANHAVQPNYSGVSIASNSTSNLSVELGGIGPPPPSP